MSDQWPRCGKCRRSIMVHHLFKWYGYCDSARSDETKGTFTAGEVNRVRRALGQTISDPAQDAEKRESSRT